MRIFQVKTTILENIHITSQYYLLKIFTEDISKSIVPGQFINIGITDTYDPLLKRPFSPYLLHREEGIVEIFYKVVGKGTSILSSMKKGDSLEVTGPHGNNFIVPQNAKRIAVVGRGVGIAPLVFLAQMLHLKGVELFAFLSMESPEFIIGKEELEGFGAKIYCTTSNSELVTDKLWEILKKGEKIDAIYTCGSRRLRREVAKISDKYGIWSQVSLESVMACGIGVCMGCTVKVGNSSSWKYKRVCREGPVFDTREVIDE